jgi:hypothetical protein
MVCPTCGLDNDPFAGSCARCNTALSAPPPRPAQEYEPPTQSAYRPAPEHKPSPAYQPEPEYQPPSAFPPPGYPPPLPRSRMPLLAGVAVLLLIAVVAAGLYLRRDKVDQLTAIQPTATVPTPDPTPSTTDPTPTPTPTVDERSQAAVIDSLLDRSVASRNKLNQAIDRVNRCTDLNGALADMRTVGDERRAQLSEVGSADLTALPEGEELRRELSTALQHSLRADEAYVRWTQPTLAAGCDTTAARSAAQRDGRSASDQAGAAKVVFLSRWNPIAADLGLPTRSRDKI